MDGRRRPAHPAAEHASHEPGARATLAPMTLDPAVDMLRQATRAHLYALLRERGQPMETAELAKALGRHPNGVRAHLEELESVGLVSRSRARQARGRPRDAWAVAPRTDPLPAPGDHAPAPVVDADLERLADLRGGLRNYLAWAEQLAREHGTTPAQFQLALAIRASRNPAGPTLSELADTLLLRHHSVVGLVDRAADAGLVQRLRDPESSSRVRVRLTAHGHEQLTALAALHLRRLAELAPQMQALWGAFATNRLPASGS
jgi:DNA-binding MarR family transcriptional regulator